MGILKHDLLCLNLKFKADEIPQFYAMIIITYELPFTGFTPFE